jgi:hypothetical protein
VPIPIRPVVVSPPFSSPRPRVEGENRFFLTQWGPTKWNTAGAPDGYKDCGPTTALIALAKLGLVDHPDARAAEAKIEWMRDLTRGGVRTPQSGPTYQPMLIKGLRATGADAVVMPMTTAAIDQCLDDGGVACIAGRPQFSWGRALDQRGEYLHHFDRPNGDDGFGHWCAVLGKTTDGLYVVADPLSTCGCIAVNASSLERFFADGAELATALDVTAG